ncbi:MAG: hypothetical protein ACK4ND_00755 [Cytophagaceae bacterium]
MKHIFIPVLLILIAFSSCEKKQESKSETKALSEAASETLITEFKTLEDSLEQSWNQMIKADDEKIDDVKRLLQEISFCKRYNVLTHDTLTKLVSVLKEQRYNRESLIDSKIIDKYDNLTDSLIAAVFKLTQATTEMESHDITEKLVTDINQANNDDLLKLRVNYDKWALKYNSFIEEHEAELKTLGLAPGSLKKKPLFQIQ